MSLSDDAEFPACPTCETNLLVERSHHNHIDWACHGCGGHYNTAEMATRTNGAGRP
jgi:ribosomal protein L37AE/L43A